MYCQRCGAPAPSDPEARFCSACGAPLGVASAAAPPGDSTSDSQPDTGAPVTPTVEGPALETSPQTDSSRYGGFLIRLVAYLVDAVIISTALGIVGGVIAAILAAVFGVAAVSGPSETFVMASLFGSIGLLLVISLAVSVAYYVVLPPIYGATPGKLILGYEIVDGEFRRIGYGASTLRWLGYMVSGAVIYLGFIWIGLDDKKQAWHDKIAGTFVVKKEYVRR